MVTITWKAYVEQLEMSLSQDTDRALEATLARKLGPLVSVVALIAGQQPDIWVGSVKDATPGEEPRIPHSGYVLLVEGGPPVEFRLVGFGKPDRKPDEKQEFTARQKWVMRGKDREKARKDADRADFA